MGVLSLVLGILGLFSSWIAPSAGAAMSMGSTLTTGEMSTGALWGIGGIFGVLLPIVAIVAGILAIKSGKKKGLGIAGLVMGSIGTIIGIIMMVALLQAASVAQKGFDQLSEGLGDGSEMGEVLKQAMEEAAKQQQ